MLTDHEINGKAIAYDGELYLVVLVDAIPETNPPARIYNSLTGEYSDEQPLQVFFKWGNFVSLGEEAGED